MNLLIDLGNSRVKWRLKQSGQTLAAGSDDYSGQWQWLVEISAIYSPDNVWVSSVQTPICNESLERSCRDLGLPEVSFAQVAPSCLGVVCGYSDVASLGVDRWLALLAARDLTAGDVVVVDSGTALTVDLLRADGCHLGGYIAPGLTLMRQSLAGRSQALASALAEVEKLVSLEPGSDTATAIGSAIAAMGCGLIDRARSQLPADATMILTGGDAPYWASVYGGARVEQELVFMGLERYFIQAVECGP